MVRKLISEEHQDSVIYDQEGNEVLRVGQIIYTYQNDDGSISTFKESQNIVCADGRVYNFSETLKSDPNYLSMCPACRSSSLLSNHSSLVLAKEMRKCVKCGVNVCSRHYRLGHDEKIRCLFCHDKHVLHYSILRPLFFKKV